MKGRVNTLGGVINHKLREVGSAEGENWMKNGSAKGMAASNDVPPSWVLSKN